MTSSNVGQLDWLLDDLLERLPGVRYAVVLSYDGMLLSGSTAMTRDNAEHFCALASALHGLARSAGTFFDIGGVRQSVIEHDHGFLFVTAAGDNACLALLTEPTANMGMVAFEMNQTVQRVGTFLSAAPRPPASQHPDL
ncbi:putative regulator of Ras-like GTPase activity (Roadblock/LC7/MglB family) [Nocardia kruczakiae]|uniref:Regulator of Ras-like GTPase activity (Roadblock/LC7/MglB family) n=1 Tax=Nocardia kruczakiae TaxID=261477 RepID=A0ABU1XA05_9NOCA|nr:roadblock/LC7 domain-containing protein [Nocardia kruczakiae]MDR7167368.1 putative regulator of Ras-like GTPase activity (Roadblock/LC7/MglB family) [Nocardia kruczakiae]